MKTSPTPVKAPKCGTFMGIKGVQLTAVRYEFTQGLDTNDDAANICQELKVFTEDSGGGSYLVIETPRWALDSDDIGKFCDAMKKISNIPEEDGT